MEHLVIRVASSDAPRLEEEVAAFEIGGVEILNPQDSMYYESTWEEDEAPNKPEGRDAVLKIYGEKVVLDQLRDHFSEIILQARYEKSEEKDWNALWAQQFTGIEAGNIFVRPPWIDKKENFIDLVIEPGMAFGTGSHETTLLSLRALADYMKAGFCVYDVGTGSGILAILAKVMGAADVYGIEIDAKALENARLNARLNGVAPHFSQGDLLRGCTKKADLIVANILPPVLKRMKEDAYALLKDKGILLLSGILDIRVQEIMDVYGDSFTLIDNRSMGQWHVLILEKR